MPYRFYVILHILGAFMVFLSYGGLIVRSATGSDNKDLRRLGAMTSGIGLLLLLVGGFGLLAKLNYGFPGWVLAKIGLWVILGSLIVLINRQPKLSQILWWVTLLIGLCALMLVHFKPF